MRPTISLLATTLVSLLAGSATIAGPAYTGDGKEKRGATGFGVSTTIGWLRALVGSARR